MDNVASKHGFEDWLATPISRQHALGAGWSSPVARQAHNLKVVSSNLAPATNLSY